MGKLVRLVICLGLAAAFALGASTTIAIADAGGPGVTAAAYLP